MLLFNSAAVWCLVGAMHLTGECGACGLGEGDGPTASLPGVEEGEVDKSVMISQSEPHVGSLLLPEDQLAGFQEQNRSLLERIKQLKECNRDDNKRGSDQTSAHNASNASSKHFTHEQQFCRACVCLCLKFVLISRSKSKRGRAELGRRRRGLPAVRQHPSRQGLFQRRSVCCGCPSLIMHEHIQRRL